MSFHLFPWIMLKQSIHSHILTNICSFSVPLSERLTENRWSLIEQTVTCSATFCHDQSRSRAVVFLLSAVSKVTTTYHSYSIEINSTTEVGNLLIIYELSSDEGFHFLYLSKHRKSIIWNACLNRNLFCFYDVHLKIINKYTSHCVDGM